MFSPKIYQERRRQLSTQLPDALLLLPGNDEAPMNYRDNAYPFRQDSTFRYFAGHNQPGLTLLINTATGKSTLYGTEPGMDHTIWMGQQPSLEELAQSSGIEQTGSPAELAELLAKTRQPIHYLPPYRAERQAQLMAWLGLGWAHAGERFSTALVRAVVKLRSIKSAAEVAEMEGALYTTYAMHRAAQVLAAPGMTEAAVAGQLEGIAIAAGGRLAYPAIVTRNGHILHNHYHGNTLAAGDLLLIDAGAESTTGYAADITRTFSVGQTMTAQQQEIFDIVAGAHRTVIEQLHPGVAYRTYHQLAALTIATGLKALGLMTGDPGEAVAAGAHAVFFPHGLGHLIGMDVHDLEDLGEDLVGYDEEVSRSNQFGTRSLRLGRRLQPGFTLTVEPGIYFIPPLLDQWEADGRHRGFINYRALAAYRDFGGIRLEDNVLITETGRRVLAADARV